MHRNELSAYLGKEKKHITVNNNVQVTKFIGQYINSHIGASQIHFSDPPNHRPLDARFVGSTALRAEYARLKKDVLLKCKILRNKDKLSLRFTQENGDTFSIGAGDVVRCKARVFGRVIDIKPGVSAPGNDPRPRPQLHLHVWKHEMDGPLETHAHPKRLFQTEGCRDVSHLDVLEKLDIVDGHVTSTGHPHMKGENSYICSHRLVFSTNSFKEIPAFETGCPGCLKKNERKPIYSVGDFVVYRTDHHDPKQPSDIGLIKSRRQDDRYVVLPLARWDDFVSQEGVRDAMVFRKDEKLWYAPKASKTTSVCRILAKVTMLGLSRVAELGATIRPSSPSAVTDFWLGKRQIDEAEDIFCLIDGSTNLEYLYQNETKRREWSGRTDWLNGMRHDLPTSPLPPIAGIRSRIREIGQRTAILDCCAGIGGFSMGVVEATGASVPLAVEKDADIGSLYAKLHPASTVVSEGVAYAAKNWRVLKQRLQLDSKQWVILQAGVPCQPFSRLNRCPKPDDPRIGVIFEVLSLLQVSGATHLLIECVDGMIYHQNTHVGGDAGDVLKLALRALTDLGYAYSINVHQAAAYGTPQSRKRLFIWAAKLGLPLPAPPAPTHYAGVAAICQFGRFRLQPVSREGPLRYLKQVDAVSDLPEILSAEEEAFDGQWRAQFYGFWEGAKSYKTPPLNNFQLRVRNYDLGGRVMLQYCHIPTEGTYKKMLAAADDDKARRVLPGTFPCVTTGSLDPHPTQQRSFSPRERLRAQGFPDYFNLRFGDLKKEDLYKESDFICLLSGNAVPVPLSTAHGRAFVKAVI